MFRYSMLFSLALMVWIFAFTSTLSSSDESIKKGEVLYTQYCGTCHGAEHQGGMSQSLADSEWEFGSDDESIIKNIKDGIDELSMPSFKEVLLDEDINNLVAYIRQEEKNRKPKDHKTIDVLETFEYSVNVQLYAENLEEPWAIDFISPQKAIVTEKPGRLRIIENGKLLDAPIIGIPKVLYESQGGLLDVAVDPEYSENGWIYLSFSHEIDNLAMTKVVRGKLNGKQWVKEETLFESPPQYYLETRHHYGSRIVFDDDGHLFFSIGDRGKRNHAQDISRPNGKIHRINKDGSIPKDNPFVGVDGAMESIFAFGSRNAQGLAINPITGKLWETEHGQKGGDEVNIIHPGLNYGWDKITYGRNYDGTVSTEFVKLPGMEIPILFWRPSIATCGLNFYKGELFSKWQNHLIVGALKYEEVRLLDIENDRVIHQEIILKDAGRVRDICSGPDGAIYVVLNKPGNILRLTPSN